MLKFSKAQLTSKAPTADQAPTNCEETEEKRWEARCRAFFQHHAPKVVCLATPRALREPQRKLQWTQDVARIAKESFKNQQEFNDKLLREFNEDIHM